MTNKVDYDSIVPGSPEWRTLSHAKRNELQDKRLGGQRAKVYTMAEAQEAGIAFDEGDWDDSHIPDPNNVKQLQPKHKAVVRGLADLSEAEARELGYKAYENWKQTQPTFNRDDTHPSDKNPRDPNINVTRVRDVEGTDYKVERRNPYGFYYVVGLEHDLGSFLGLKDANDALIEYLKKQREKEAYEATRRKEGSTND